MFPKFKHLEMKTYFYNIIEIPLVIFNKLHNTAHVIHAQVLHEFFIMLDSIGVCNGLFLNEPEYGNIELFNYFFML